MPWKLITKLLGPGLLWNKTQQQFLTAITIAERQGRKDAADHLRGMLKLRNQVMCEKPIDPDV